MKWVETKKDAVKVLRTIAEIAVLALVISLPIKSVFFGEKYVPFQEQENLEMAQDCSPGFISVSYFGVDRQGTNTLIGVKRLEEHLQALKDNGYVTISQQDVLDYYNDGKPLPQKALLLVFEDGRTDTAVFAEPIIQKMNYKATVCSYSEKFETNDPKFLMPDGLLDLEKGTFWELGTNGHRLAYINVFDRYRNFFGEMTSWEFIEVAPYLGREYNHYLMDFIRDENYLPVESTQAMRDRITRDYALMDSIYKEKIGRLPSLYILMHSNSDQFGNSPRVSEVNGERIAAYFPMNINREGYSLNTLSASIYDLTRLEGQSFWYPNHLLMRIWDDLSGKNKEDITFIDGDLKRKAHWDTIEGASEFQEDRIILTTLPDGSGLMRLRDEVPQDNGEVSMELTGTLLTQQSVVIGADKDSDDVLGISIVDNMLLVTEGWPEVQKEAPGVYSADNVVAEVDLNELLGIQFLSTEEDERDSLTAAYNARAHYADTLQDTMAYRNEANAMKNRNVASVDEGSDAYVPVTQINELGNRKLKLRLVNGKLSVWVNQVLAIDRLSVSKEAIDGLFLMAHYVEDGTTKGTSQRNIYDNVCDGVFEKVLLTTTPYGEDVQICYDNRLSGLELALTTVKRMFDRVVNWFIVNL